jgi:hypothetical protein
MKRIVLALFLLAGMSGVSLAQDSLKVEPVPPATEGQYGESATGASEGESKEDRVKVQASEIPARMGEELRKNDKYAGWENGTIFYEKNSDQYLVHIQKENTTETYRFTKLGEPVTDDALRKEPAERQ